MEFEEPVQRPVFFELHSGLRREGPGSRACSERALRLTPFGQDVAQRHVRVLDVACGPAGRRSTSRGCCRPHPSSRSTCMCRSSRTCSGAWRPLLAPGGCIAFSESVRLRCYRSPMARENWAEYPATTDAAGVRAEVVRAGYEPMGDFMLPPEAWWDESGPA